jgi:hypothetical protein
MKSAVVLLLVQSQATVPPAAPGSSIPASVPATFASQFGPTGAIRTPGAATVGHLRGKLAIWENLGDEDLDQVVLTVGATDFLELGLQSDIPSRARPALGFWFKGGIPQDWLFRGQPGTAFGIHRDSTFVVMGYRTLHLAGNAGFSFSDSRTGPFLNATVSPLEYLAAQAEYDHAVKQVGVGLRGSYRFVQLSFTYHLPVDQRAGWDGPRAFVAGAYQF